MDIQRYNIARNKFISDYLEAADGKKKMNKTYAVLKFDTSDGNLLYSISKNIEIIGLMNTFYGNKSWIVINHGNDKRFDEKIETIRDKYEKKGCKVSVMYVKGNK